MTSKTSLPAEFLEDFIKQIFLLRFIRTKYHHGICIVFACVCVHEHLCVGLLTRLKNKQPTTIKTKVILISHTSLKVDILLSLTLLCWDHRYEPPHLTETCTLRRLSVFQKISPASEALSKPVSHISDGQLSHRQWPLPTSTPRVTWS